MARTPKPWFREERQSWFVTINGERHNLGPDKDEALRQFHLLMAQKPEEQPAPATHPAKTDSLCVAGLFDKYLDWCQKHRAAKTYSWYKTHIQSFMDALGPKAAMPVTDLKPFHVQEWVDGHTSWGASFRHGAIRSVQRAFNWAVKLGHLEKSPVSHIEKPTPERRDNPMSPGDFATLLTAVKDQAFRDLLEFAWESGCRPQEARLIEARHVVLPRARIEIPPDEAKGKKCWRLIYLSDKALAIVKRLLGPHQDGKLFRNARGNPWKAFAVCNRFTRLKKKLGQAFALYDIRHGFTQRLLEGGEDHLTVAALLGHANGDMVSKVYSHMNRADGHLREALKSASR